MNPDTPLEKAFRINDIQKAGLKRLGLSTVRDLLYHFPFRYGDIAEVRSIASAVIGEDGVFFGKISKLEAAKGWKSKIPMAKAILSDESGSLDLVWFNQPYLSKMFFDGQFVRVEGKVSARKGKLSLLNPKIEKTDTVPMGVGKSLFNEVEGSTGETHSLYPVYSEARGITSNWIYHSIIRAIKAGALEKLADPVPQEILDRYHLPSLKTALIWVHTPMKQSDADGARKRFGFEEMLFIQIQKQRDKLHWQKSSAFVIEKSPEDIEEFVSRFPFAPTSAQRRAIARILEDFGRGYPMSRLLEGDVGSGKTAVAAASCYAAVTTRPQRSPSSRVGEPQVAAAGRQDFGTLQVAYMAPTEILAKQHFESFIKYFEHMHISIGLITGSGCRKFPSKVNPKTWTDISRAQLLKWVANGEIAILVGTHALIQKSVKFKHLAYAIVDEQHRFGTAQRQKLVQKNNLPIEADAVRGARKADSETYKYTATNLHGPSNKEMRRLDGQAPHFLSMTATPIPRTLALTVYGDLDLTLLDEMPAGRKQIITEIVTPDKRSATYEEIRKILAEGRQLYVICPRIDEPDPLKAMALNVKSVKEEAKRLKKSVFPEYEIGILHSKMRPVEKEQAMADFAAGKTNILVATSVVEVGVNVPNATMIIIEGAERFGLSQLHQLRGRVQRSSHQAYCFVFADSKGERTHERMKAFKTAKNGFELAEFDLAQRGSGDLFGTKQWGISDVAMEGIKNLKLVEAARNEAERIVADDPELSRSSAIRTHLEERARTIHFE